MCKLYCDLQLLQSPPADRHELEQQQSTALLNLPCVFTLLESPLGNVY
jgi:hypothetical protein